MRMFEAFVRQGRVPARLLIATALTAAAIAFAGCSTFRDGFDPGGQTGPDKLDTAGSDWASYITETESGARAAIIADLALYRSAPVAGKETLLSVELEMLNARSDGLSSAEEADTLNEINEKIAESLQQTDGAINAGRLKQGGKVTMYFYLPRGKNAKKTVDKAMAGYPEYRYRVETREEREWETYRRSLYPKPEKLRSILNGRIVDRLIESGDTLERKRRVEHRAYFRSAEQQKLYVEFVAGNGFNIESLDIFESVEKPYGVHFSRTDYVDHDSVDGYTIELWKHANELGGEYDGWETVVISGDDDHDLGT